MILGICQHPKFFPLIQSSVFGTIRRFVGIRSDYIKDALILSLDLHV